MESDLYETQDDYQGGIMDAPKIIVSDMCVHMQAEHVRVHAHAHRAHKHACTFILLLITFKQFRIWRL